MKRAYSPSFGQRDDTIVNMIKAIRLKTESIADLIAFTRQDGFPYAVDEEMVRDYCRGDDPVKMCVQTYGVYDDEKLIAVMTASYMNVFYHPDSPHGKTVQISGAFTIPERRSQGFGKMLLETITEDARKHFGADYLCCDTISPQFFGKYGFRINAEDRMWIII